MAYRRKQGLGRSSTFKEEMYQPPADLHASASASTPTHASSSSLASQAIRASANAHLASTPKGSGGPTYDYTSMGSSNEAGSFWGILARKAKAILEEDNEHTESTRLAAANSSRSNEEVKGLKIMENPTAIKGIGPFTTSTNHNGNAFEVRRKDPNSPGQQKSSMNRTTPEDQLKASRDVAMATAAKAKLLLRELKTVKADLTFAKQRCSQLEDENKILREASEKGVNPEDDDMIRLQLETLLAEKARLAHENSVYARENRYLREIVEFHQLTMQDVVDLDDGIDEVAEAYTISVASRTLSAPSSPSTSPGSNFSSLRHLCRASSLDATARFSMDLPGIPKRAVKTNTKSASPKDFTRKK